MQFLGPLAIGACGREDGSAAKDARGGGEAFRSWSTSSVLAVDRLLDPPRDESRPVKLRLAL